MWGMDTGCSRGKVFGTHHDEATGGRASAERLAEVLRHVPPVPEGVTVCSLPRSPTMSVHTYKGKRHAMLLKRRKAEFALLYIP